ncbi:MAG: (Fe-S)-binding protein [Gammaproteobacteria bacterium]
MPDLAKQIDQAAQQCVKCGLCLPYCPTYVVAKNENESARGRIALAQGAVRAQVPISELLTYHLDTCLACRACEAVCPAGVKYEELITSTRAWLNPTHKPSAFERIIIHVLEHPWLRRLFSAAIRIFQRFNWLQKFTFKLRQIKLFSLASYIPVKPVNKNTSLSLPSVTRGRALLLAPCASEVFDQRTINDAQKIIQYFGLEVTVPNNNSCCGALSLHAGQLSQAQHCADQQIKQWNELQPNVILSLASGCHATLQEYACAPLDRTVPNIPLQMIEEFVLQQIIAQKKKLRPLPKRLIVHTPCTLRNAIRKPQLTPELLRHIPDATCISIPASMGCCGAAGSYFFRHADIAKKLVTPIVAFIREQQPDVWLTSNIGCALHIQHALREEGIDIPVLHPISLVLEQLYPNV